VNVSQVVLIHVLLLNTTIIMLSALPRPNAFTLVRGGSNRVVNGRDAKPGEYPYIVSLDYTGRGHTCGAAPITSTWVVTAGHCCE